MLPRRAPKLIHCPQVEVKSPPVPVSPAPFRWSFVPMYSHPETKVLYTSGYTDEAIVHHGVLEEGVQLLNKPYTLVELTRRVRKALNS